MLAEIRVSMKYESLRSNGLPRVEVTVFITVIYFRLMSECKWAEGPLSIYI